MTLQALCSRVPGRWYRLFVLGGMLAALGRAAPTEFHIPAQPAAAALLAFSKQAAIEVVFSFDDLQSRRAHAVTGRFEPAEALAQLLAGTGFTAVAEANGKWTVKREAAADRPAAANPDRPAPRTSRAAPAAPMTAADHPEDTIQMEAFTVTGSNLRRVDTEAALPVSVIDFSEISLRGASTMAELFESITIAEPSVINENNYGAQGARGDVASIDLRGIGVGSTLTLLNGRRMAPFPISTSEGGVPALAGNINAIPTSLVSRVEILRDGASAIYGADAAAGVINTIVSRTYQGARVNTAFAVTQHGGANEARVSLAEGFQRGKLHFSVAFDYFHRDRLAAVDRPWSRQADLRLTQNLPAPWNGLPLLDANGAVVRDNDFDNSQSITTYGVWQRGTLLADGSFVGSRPAGNVGIVTTTTPGPVATLSSTGQFNYFRNAAGDMVWKQSAPSRDIDSPERVAYANVNQWRVFLPRTDRQQLALFADRPLTARTDFFGDVLFYHARSVSNYEPVNFNSTDGVDMVVPATNPWNPFGARFYHPTGAPNADGTPRLVGTPADIWVPTAVRLPETKERPFVVESFAYRWLSGLRGRLGDDWQWESALTYSGAQTHEYDRNVMRESRVRRSLLRTDASAYNPFGQVFKIVDGKIAIDRAYTNPAAVVDPLYDVAERFGRTDLAMWDAKLNGQLGQLFRGGHIGLAAGAEFRWEDYSDARPPFFGVNPPEAIDPPFLRENDNDVINNSANIPLRASQNIAAVYVEASFPFVTRANRLPLVESLELTLAGRHERFSIHGQATKPKASLFWNPTSWLKLRGSYNESFRAPNLAQTNTNALVRYISSTDYYRYEVTSLADDGSHLRRTLSQGNDRLRPEQAKSWVTGLVLDVPMVRGLACTFDYWRLRQRDAFANMGAAATLQRDELYLDLATQAELAKGTPIDQIDLGSGSANYRGFNVTRLPVTADDRARFAAYNAKQPTNATKRAPVGEFVSLISQYMNLGMTELEGYELGLQYRLPRSRLGQLQVRADASHYLRRDEQAEEGAPILSTLGRNGRTTWRASGSLLWKREGWTASWFTSYYGGFVDTSAATTEAVYRALNYPKHIKEFNDNGAVRYYYRVRPAVVHNVSLAYRFAASAPRWLRGLSLRGGINNLLDTDPPLIDEANGFQSGVNIRGRQFLCEITRQF